MKKFLLGFLAATMLWAGMLGMIEIPEYTVIHRTQAVCT